MPYASESDLKYIEELDDIPIAGDDIDTGWNDQDDKLPAAEAGESKLEADVNEGREITDPENIHAEAANAWATYRLVVGMKSPDSSTRGDSMDEGEERMSFAQAMKDMYWELVDSIRNAEFDEGEDSGSGEDGGASNIDFMVADWHP